MARLALGRLALSSVIGLAMLAAAAGCGKPRTGTVSGNVTLDGAPLAAGTISFLPADGATATAAGPIKDGRYSVEMPPGKKTVQISAMEVIGTRPAYEGDPNSPLIEEVRERIPPEYNGASTLSVTVAGGSAGHDFDLRSAAKTDP
jgi:hypothetical protein